MINIEEIFKPSDTNQTETAKYNPKLFLQMAQNENFFRQKLPNVIREVMLSYQFTHGTDQNNQAEQQMYAACQTIWKEGSRNWYQKIYGKYARSNKLQKKVTTQFGEFELIKEIEELTEKEQSDWTNYLNLIEIPRVEVVLTLRELKFQLPPSTLISDPSVRLLYERLVTVPYDITLTVLPDISDEEAKQIFGQNMNAQKVRELAVDPKPTTGNEV